MQFSFFKKMVVFIVIPVFIGLLLMASFSYIKARDTLNETLQEQLMVMAETQAENFHALIIAYRNTALELSTYPAIVEASLAYSIGDTTVFKSLEKSVNSKLAETSSQMSAIFGLGVIDTKGKVFLHSNPARIGVDWSNEPFASQALKGISGTGIVSLAEHKKGLAIGQPIYEGKKIVGAVAIIIDLNILSERTIDKVTYLNSGVLGVHDEKGVQIMHRNRQYVGLEEGDTDYFKTMKTSHEGKIVFASSEGNRIWFYHQVPEFGWYVSSSILESDFYSGATNLFFSTLWIVCLISIIISSIIFVFARKTSYALGGIERISHEVSNGRIELLASEDILLEQLSIRRDEVGGLASSFKKMIVALIETIKQAKEAHKDGMVEAALKLEAIVESTSTATQELSAQIQESNNGAEIQADRISSTVTAVEEMNATILEVTQNTVQTAKIATDTKQKAEESEVIVHEFMQSISKVEKSTSTLKADMSKLSNHVQNINQIMGVISDLADQTNLLALNAAIEAARAGEFGRGFAVVADEVRKLAEKTMASTVGVSNAVIAIQSSTESSMRQVDDTVNLVNGAIELAVKCQEALNEIMIMAAESAERIGSIAVASEEQSATSEEIAKTINDINSIVGQTSNTMREANIAITELAKQTANLSKMVATMKG